ncbi:MAG: sodium transporter [Spirochaetes bacterium]|nr:MAG: sodium transporter [Spirochaetota bacterium]
MNALDWIIVAAYIAGVVGMSFMLARRQESREDYYLGGRTVPWWLVGSSLLANQVSAISLIGAPAFIALRAGGGLVWMQYEIAVPLAMAVVIVFLVPVFRRAGGITIYEFAEKRFGVSSRVVLSVIFLASRSMGAGVILLATSYVSAAVLGIDLGLTILLIGAVTVLYTTAGGILADIYTDFVQLVILWIASFACIGIIAAQLGGDLSLPAESAFRATAFRFGSTGLGDGDPFSFWPMVIGGFFLYVSYYGCDQSQAQRLLATASTREAQKALLMNGVVRFLLTATYCAVGVLMIPFLERTPEFAASLAGAPPDFLMPRFYMEYVPAGLKGVLVAGILAASMSSLDSAMNSLSASAWEDVLVKIFPRLAAAGRKTGVVGARALSVGWGVFATWFALNLVGGPETVIELVNRIGSAFYGPVAGFFALGILFPRVRGAHALTGLVSGVALNIFLWRFFGDAVSWMWWNAAGFFTALLTGFLLSLPGGDENLRLVAAPRRYFADAPRGYISALAAWTVLIAAACAGAGALLAR